MIPVKCLNLFSCMWMSICSRIICWKESLWSNVLSLLLCQRSPDSMWIYLCNLLFPRIYLFILLPILYHLYCCCSIFKSSPTLCNPMDFSTPGFPVLHYHPEFAWTHVHWIRDATQPSHPLTHPLPSVLNHLSIRVSPLHQITKALNLQF